jgi:hypothetical protein
VIVWHSPDRVPSLSRASTSGSSLSGEEPVSRASYAGSCSRSRASARRRDGLLQQVKAVEQLTIEAALTGDPGLAVQAFATHPLVDSVATARALLDGYRAAHPALAALFG